MTSRWARITTVAALRAAVSIAVLCAGFRALSDDDYARTVIAQGFAFDPRLDPSQTSWLPLPFWLTGAVMTLFGPSVTVARVTSVVLGFAAALAPLWAGAWLGLSLIGRWLGALLAILTWHSAVLGAAMVPEYPTAALLLLAIASTVRPELRIQVIGALSACLATLCRYEAWPIAVVVAAFGAIRLIGKQRSWRGWAVPVLACTGMLAWLAHGLVAHQDALFFVRRVQAYRAALGPIQVDLLGALGRHLRGCVLGEPELTALVLVATAGAAVSGPRPFANLSRAIGHFAVAAAVLLIALSVGDLGGGSPTHHVDRSLTVIWMAMALLTGELLSRTWHPVGGRLHRLVARVALVVCSALLVGTTALWLRPEIVPVESTAQRRGEVAIGRLSATLVPEDQRLAILTPDYGYLAVQAGFARPERSVPLLSHDPRSRSRRNPTASPAALGHALSEVGATWLVVPASLRSLAETIGKVRAKVPGWLLVARFGHPTPK